MEHDASPQPAPPPRRAVSLGVVQSLVGMLLIVPVVGVMMYVSRPAPNLPADAAALAQNRSPEQILAQARADEQQALTTYGWVDPKQGVVRIPIEAAMEKLLAQSPRLTSPVPPTSQAATPPEAPPATQAASQPREP